MAKFSVTIPALLVLLVALVSLGEMRSIRCCTDYNKMPIPVGMLQDYSLQKNTGYCNIKAVIFTTNNRKKVCANPKDRWVQEAMDVINSRKTKRP